MQSEGHFDLFEAQELNLFLTANGIPGWAIGRRARMVLSHFLFELHADDAIPKTGTVDISRDGDVGTIRKFAALRLGVIAHRSIGSACCLLACGYAPEAKTPVRRLMEAVIRAKAVADDSSGDHARAWLAERPMGSPARLRHRYGLRQDIGRIFSKTAHAEMTGLNELHRRSASDDLLLAIGPDRDDEADKSADILLHAMGLQVLFLIYALGGLFKPLLSETTIDEVDELARLLGLEMSIFIRPTDVAADASSREG